MARELYSGDEELDDDDDDNDIEENEQQEADYIDKGVQSASEEENAQPKAKTTYSTSPSSFEPAGTPSKFTSAFYDRPNLPSPLSSKMRAYSTSKSSEITAPIIARADQPGSKIKPLSDLRSRLNFEELRRKWDERVAREQLHLDEQCDRSRGEESQVDRISHHEGHRGTAVTSILPTIDRKSRSGDETRRGKSFTDGRNQSPSSVSPESASKSRYLFNRSNTFPDRIHTSGSSSRVTDTTDHNEPYAQSPHSVLSEPATDREEKEAKFSYNHEKLRVSQENIGHLSPLARGKEFQLLLRSPQSQSLHLSPMNECIIFSSRGIFST
ncbi:unnamed protein product [Echinostoma caproni]|uniref:Similar to n=1 Tax=Echinostoma caproni TaxID=27848 RepID=A0A183AZ95_9TREM|nr:unnamed protein product [Echinostoma caproni]